MKKFKSIMRALKRGSLRWNFQEVLGEWGNDPITGIMQQKIHNIPFLERKTSSGNWIKY